MVVLPTPQPHGHWRRRARGRIEPGMPKSYATLPTLSVEEWHIPLTTIIGTRLRNADRLQIGHNFARPLTNLSCTPYERVAVHAVVTLGLRIPALTSNPREARAKQPQRSLRSDRANSQSGITVPVSRGQFYVWSERVPCRYRSRSRKGRGRLFRCCCSSASPVFEAVLADRSGGKQPVHPISGSGQHSEADCYLERLGGKRRQTTPLVVEWAIDRTDSTAQSFGALDRREKSRSQRPVAATALPHGSMERGNCRRLGPCLPDAPPNRS
jgi:hypothetical protein